jgi:predicted DNA-binding transcriptional regulator AlpA
MSQPKPTINFDALPDDALIRLRQLLALHLVPYSASTLWRHCRRNEFPAPVKVSPGVTAWRVGDVRTYLDGLVKSSKGAAE